MYILDQDQQPVPEGAKGEIYVAGIQVMRGYLQANRLSATAVLPDPWFTGERMYRTGDFGARGHDGRVTYLGRIDRQVKLRGFRVELAEVEQAVMSIGEYEGMTQCSAVALDGTLVAFVTCSPGKPLLSSEAWLSILRDRLKARLFSASTPDFIIQLERFPMNFNGKVDARALASLYAKRKSDLDSSVALSVNDSVGAKVAKEWLEILQLEPDSHLRSSDNFFSLGGHSVLMLLLANRLSTAFQVEVTLRELLPAPTLGGQVALINDLLRSRIDQSEDFKDPEDNNRVGLPAKSLTPLEELVWHQCQVSTTSTAFNIGRVLHITGSVDHQRLVDSFNQALASDPVFRTNIAEGPEGLERLFNTRVPTVRLVSDLNIDAELSQEFDLEHDHLIRVLLTSGNRETDETYSKTMYATQIGIVTSHVIADLGSLQNLLHLVSQAYVGVKLPVYDTPRHLESEKWTRMPTSDERDWWRSYLDGHGYRDTRVSLLSNPIHDQAQRSFNGASRVRQYSGGLIDDLNARIRETGTTQHQLVLSATALVLQWLSGEHDLVLGAPDSGRRTILEREACGQFLDRLPVRVCLPQSASETEWTTNTLLSNLRDSAHKALANAIPFHHILRTLDYPDKLVTGSMTTGIHLCECMVTFHAHGAGLDNWLRLDECEVSETHLFAEGSKFPLMFEWSEKDSDQWSVHMEFNTDCIDIVLMDTMEEALGITLGSIAKNAPLSRLLQDLGNLRPR
jgi:hypothetical protein